MHLFNTAYSLPALPVPLKLQHYDAVQMFYYYYYFSSFFRLKFFFTLGTPFPREPKIILKAYLYSAVHEPQT